MSEFVRYALLANAGVLLVWVAYRLFLHGNTLHWCNRAYLMFGTALALIAPSVPAGTTTQEVIGMQLPAVTVSDAVQAIKVVSESWTGLAIGYFAGALLMLAYQSVAFFNVWRIIRRSLKSRVCGVAVYRSADAGPFSFFGMIHIPLDCDGIDADVILRHELVHVRQWHSLDVLCIGLLRIVFWFNPLLLFVQRDLQALHEYMADDEALHAIGREKYAHLQMAQLFGLRTDLFPVNSFSHPLNLKNRMTMMYKEKTNRIALVRYALLLPLATVIVLASACVQPQVDVAPNEVEKALTQAEKMPEYPGGFQALASELGASIQFPESAKADSVEGTVFVQFVVGADGKVEDVEVAKSVHPELDAEALRVVKSLKDWTPGEQGGQQVRVQMTLPIKFVLS
jgi:TonB family protein